PTGPWHAPEQRADRAVTAAGLSGRPVQDAVDGDGHGDLVGGLLGDHAAGVAVAVVTREVAAGNLEPNPVAGQEDVGRDRQVQAELVGLAGGEGLGLGQRVAVPRPAGCRRSGRWRACRGTQVSGHGSPSTRTGTRSPEMRNITYI